MCDYLVDEGSNGINSMISEGNPITGDGYKSMNGQINTVTSINGNSHMMNNSNRVPPGGFSSGLW